MNRIAVDIIVVGLVQGVGFRPFISRIASIHGVNGYVRNIGGSEVEIWIEGEEEKVYEFITSLYIDKPDVAIIESIYASLEEPRGFSGFTILKSSVDPYTRSNIPPDFAICRDCLSEVLNPIDRRYLYPFNSCAWCGPRFSIMYRVPYDRENTSMSKYILCDHCIREYSDIGDIRRHHAQGISCSLDGPRLLLLDRDFNRVECKDPISETAKLIDEGFIVAIKGIGGYHIATLATSDDVVLELRKRKKRPRKPFAVMGLNTDILKKLVFMDTRDEVVLNSPQAPILLLPKKPDTPVSRYVSPDLFHEGVFIAYTALHYLLLLNTRDKFLVMTSGNISGEPMCSDETCARGKLSGIVDYFLVHDREIVNRVDDSVLRKTGDTYVLIRRSRGYAPAWININRDLGGEFIAFGGDLSAAGGVGFDDKIVLTQYIGDLDSLSAQRDLIGYIEFLVRSFHIGERGRPTVVVDMHPRLYSRIMGMRYARSRGLPVVEIQHHYAHVLGTAIDIGLDGLITGLAIDGLGWGIDNTIWGCEVLLFNTEKYGFKRIASLDPLPLTSDRDTTYPLRLLIAHYASRGFEFEEITKLIGLEQSRGDLFELRTVYNAVKKKAYIPASSMGRLLDMITSILRPDTMRTYEGEPAILLEAMAWRGVDLIEIDGFKVVERGGVYRLVYDEVIDWIIAHRRKYGEPVVAKSTLHAIGRSLGEMLSMSIKGTRVENIVVSGGAAVNEFIYLGLREELRDHGLEPLLPRRIPPGDGGLVVGQIAAASLIGARGLDHGE